MTNINFSKNFCSEQSMVLTKSTLRAKDLWGLSNHQLAKIIGVSDASITRMQKFERLIQKDTKEWELAVLFLRAFRSLDSIMGGHVENEKAWLFSYNKILKDIPVNLLQTVSGLYLTVQYLDAIRGH